MDLKEAIEGHKRSQCGHEKCGQLVQEAAERFLRMKENPSLIGALEVVRYQVFDTFEDAFDALYQPEKNS